MGRRQTLHTPRAHFNFYNTLKKHSNHMSNMRNNFDAPAFLLEGCAIDPLLDDQQFAKLVTRLIFGHQIIVYVTNLTLQDIDAIPDDTRRAQLRATIETLKPTIAAVSAVLVSEESKHGRPIYPGETYLVSKEDYELLTRLKVDDRADARQALAAKWYDATLVTNNKRLISRAMKLNIKAITTEQWRAYLEGFDFIG